jgi:hypothetical protein
MKLLLLLVVILALALASNAEKGRSEELELKKSFDDAVEGSGAMSTNLEKPRNLEPMTSGESKKNE